MKGVERCSECGKHRPIVRRLTMTTVDGVLLDKSQFCGVCWGGAGLRVGVRAAVEDCTNMQGGDSGLATQRESSQTAQPRR